MSAVHFAIMMPTSTGSSIRTSFDICSKSAAIGTTVVAVDKHLTRAASAVRSARARHAGVV